MPMVFSSGPVKGAAAFLATPVVENITPAYTVSLFKSCLALQEAGIPVQYEVFAGNCHVDDSRNRLVRDFLESDCQEFVFIDADLRWDASDLIRLIDAPQDVVGGTYPFKQAEEGYPVRTLPGPIIEKNGVVEVEAIPTGFMKIKRHVLEEMVCDVPGFTVKNEVNRKLIPVLFERGLVDVNRWSGDYNFCRKWRERGGKIHLIPDMRFEHFGVEKWTGRYTSYLQKKRKTPLQEQLSQISHCQEDENTMIDLVLAWGNPKFTVGPEFLSVAMMIARESRTILECGSGLSTLVLAAANPEAEITTLEHDINWATYTRDQAEKHGLKVNVVYSPIVDYGDFKWYAHEPKGVYDFVAVDGPPRSIGRRGIEMVKFKKILIDDAEDLTPYKNLGVDLNVMGLSRKIAVGVNEKKLSEKAV